MPETGRLLIGMVAGFKSERWPVNDWNGGRLQSGIRILALLELLKDNLHDVRQLAAFCGRKMIELLGEDQNGLMKMLWKCQHAKIDSVAQTAKKQALTRCY
ncbi:hypothetical protein LAV84_22665 [Rhizobium sp. VS19-DR104.2]|uniref:hypothetical protein n=1 Tax=unclassified Rhizobium TaxID=2613769 RepID=UPI001CC58CBC|nr:MULTISPECIES: hypothetical protein [unclassified Rhizobium]MBZ5761959.1 hypothetical protein [Rhizobium sp. VS19-DR96]MBZ5768931.1 hypothetical protein [Rhizobium sp. VS19-DR129.2]MBZ5775665.1 hypothetical protein [Rhizobium sp. VS19-DRK62.2]MBZ5786837.1 hypothetical protein [Rhizobium sp. VS19-DR121]MBZ5805047.1 hypothetical protein [Rhizobium sp. VS19-DR181]